jgi:Holliday junction resolvase RusA-like endonuclease
VTLPRLNDYALRGKAALHVVGEKRGIPDNNPGVASNTGGSRHKGGDRDISERGIPGAKQTVVLPAPPSANRYWRMVNGRMLVSREGRAYKKLVDRQVTALPLIVPVAVTVRWARSKRMGDLDNRLKVCLDSLRGIAWLDDKQVVELHAYRSEGGDDTVTVTWWSA